MHREPTNVFACVCLFLCLPASRSFFQVEAILVNIFGGIMRCDTIAEGIIQAVQTVDIKVPLIVRVEGTNVEQARQMLDEANLGFITASDLDDAAQKAVASIA